MGPLLSLVQHPGCVWPLDLPGSVSQTSGSGPGLVQGASPFCPPGLVWFASLLGTWVSPPQGAWGLPDPLQCPQVSAPWSSRPHAGSCTPGGGWTPPEHRCGQRCGQGDSAATGFPTPSRRSVYPPQPGAWHGVGRVGHNSLPFSLCPLSSPPSLHRGPGQRGNCPFPGPQRGKSRVHPSLPGSLAGLSSGCVSKIQKAVLSGQILVFKEAVLLQTQNPTLDVKAGCCLPPSLSVFLSQ